MKIKCNKCNYIGDASEFPKGRDFFQNEYVRACPRCDNTQNPSDASMRMFGSKRPFEIMRDVPVSDNPVEIVKHRSEEAS